MAVVADAGGAESPQAAEAPGGLRMVVALAAEGSALYAAFSAAILFWRWPVPDSIHVGVPFLLVPVVYLAWRHLPLTFGDIDRSFVWSAAAYAPFALWVAAAAPGSSAYFSALALSIASLPLLLWWSVDTFFHVGAVDYFTKRIVQREAEAVWGPKRALLVQWAAWSVGHVVEWMWLRILLGDAGAALFLGLSGLVTGLAYMRWKNVGGLMVGHFLVNVTAAAVAVTFYA